MEDKKFAVLIDGDNTSSKDVDIIINEVAKEGIITYKRLYGDLTKPQLAAWKDVLLRNSITPVQQYAYTTGKNSTDTAMIIDAMDILYTGKVDGFCLVSSDSDFTRLAVRLREAGMLVIGMGKQHTPEPFVKACSMFKFTDLIATASKPKTETSEAPTAHTEQNNASTSATPLSEIIKSVDDLIAEKCGEGWLLASTVGDFLKHKYNEFDSRNYGFKKTIELLKSLKYETKIADDETTYFVSKRKDVEASKPAKSVQSVKARKTTKAAKSKKETSDKKVTI